MGSGYFNYTSLNSHHWNFSLCRLGRACEPQQANAAYCWGAFYLPQPTALLTSFWWITHDSNLECHRPPDLQPDVASLYSEQSIEWLPGLGYFALPCTSRFGPTSLYDVVQNRSWRFYRTSIQLLNRESTCQWCTREKMVQRDSIELSTSCASRRRSTH